MENKRAVQLRIVFSKDFNSDETKAIAESFSKILPTIKSYVATASAQPVDIATAVIVFCILPSIAEGFLKAIGSDMYNKAKEKIIESLGKRKNSTVIFQFKSAYRGTDIVINAQTNDKKELSNIFDTIDKAREIAIGELTRKEPSIVAVNYDNGWTLDSEKANHIKSETTDKVETLNVKETKILSKIRLDRLNIFEAVVVGIYGNWLISFLDKLTFTTEETISGIPIPYFQAFNVAFAFTTLLIFFAFTIFRPDEVSSRFAIIMGVAHIVGIWTTMLFEVRTIKFGLFYWLGIILFLVLYITEAFRVKLSRKKLIQLSTNE